MTKSGREIVELLEAYDLTGCAHSAAQLAGTDRKTVLRYVALRDAGADPWVRGGAACWPPGAKLVAHRDGRTLMRRR